MKFDNLKDALGSVIKDVMAEPAAEKLKNIAANVLIPAIIEEFNLFTDKLVPETKAKVQEAIMKGFNEATKEELMPEYDNQTLNKIAQKITSIFSEAVLPYITEKIRKDFLTEEFISNLLAKLIQKL